MRLRPPTLSKLTEKIARGFGRGRGRTYYPWLETSKSNSSGVSYNYFEHLPVRPQNVHMMSKLEHMLMLQACYLQPLEVREQFPLWPFEHPHPHDGWCDALDAQCGEMPGLYDLARDSGIDHGHFVGTRGLPYVATTDFVLYDKREDEGDRLTFISCKPSEVYKTDARARERVALDRIYANVANAQHIFLTEKDIDPMLCENLQWILPTYSRVELYGRSPQLHDFAAVLQTSLAQMPLGNAILRAGSAVAVQGELMHEFFRLAAWLGLIDINLTQPVVMCEYASLGGHRVRSHLHKKYWRR
jgi:hypothetical protein